MQKFSSEMEKQLSQARNLYRKLTKETVQILKIETSLNLGKQTEEQK